MKSGIYYIQNLENGKIYIGSAVNITERWRLHKVHLRNGNHHNKHLQVAWVKYGEDVFKFGVIEYIEDKDMLLEREQYWIDLNGVCDRERGYNAAPVAGSMLGFKHTEESKKKMTNMFVKGFTPWNKGKKMEGEYKKNHLKASERRKGVPSGRVGFRHTEETKKKLSIASSARVCSEETKQKMVKANTGRKLGEIHRINCVKAWEIRKLNSSKKGG
jgi:group I intron endonuclease